MFTDGQNVLEASVGLPRPSTPYEECEMALEDGARIRFSLRCRLFKEKAPATATAAPSTRKSCKTMSSGRRTDFPTEVKGKKGKKKN